MANRKQVKICGAYCSPVTNYLVDLYLYSLSMALRNTAVTAMR